MTQHVLVVDDNHINRLFLQATLRKAGHHVSLADDGFQAIEMAEKKVFDLVFMDIRMHGMDGFETAKRIQVIQNVPIIGVSAESIVDDNHVFADTLLKPLKIETVLDVMAQHVQQAVLFNEYKSLAAANNNPMIASQLKQMFLEQLPDQINQARILQAAGDTGALQDHWHQVMGGAQLCAAESFVDAVVDMKKHLQQGDEAAINKQWDEIDDLVRQMMKAVQ